MNVDGTDSGKRVVPGDLLWLLGCATHELALFAAVGLIVGGIDDLAVDAIWLARQSWRRLTVYTRHPRACVATLAPAAAPGRIVVLMGAWREAGVVGAMLETACRRWHDGDVRIYVGLYPNDPDTAAEVHAAAARDPRIRAVPGFMPGPTTKAEALNRGWAALVADEAREGWRAKAILLHDAEDVVHRAELVVFDTLIERFDLVQLPVLPLLDAGSRWIAGHYADEFAEAHGRQLVVREALGAGVPLAGTGCAIARDAIAQVAAANGGLPFNDDSLTEDYELGLKLKAFGGSCAFVRIAERPGGCPVAIRANFPHEFRAAVRQKARWLRGIAFEGWDRLGWSARLAENWMRLRDRRAPLSAIVLSTAYLLCVLGIASVVLALATGMPVPPLMPATPLSAITGALLGWRVAMRFVSVARLYGVREGLRSVPRLAVGNAIAIAAAWRALVCYAAPRRRAHEARWDKTAHSFPHAIAAE